ncbi:MAG: hypothetical protein M1142_02075 [Patescibacteria group bacterium]|nr:hypothetical protein [Patescibacteria group bacterium]
MHQRGLAPLLVVILIAVAIAGYVIYQKQIKPVSLSRQIQATPSPVSKNESSGSADVANWKTYTDQNVSFKYPSDWNVYHDRNNGVNVHCSNCSSIYNSDFFQIEPTVLNSIASYTNTFRSTQFDLTNITFNGDQAVKSSDGGGKQAGGSSIVMFVLHNGAGYQISYRHPDLLNEKKLSNFPSPNPDIISTFKFTN